MLKHARNCLALLGTFFTSYNERVEWKFLLGLIAKFGNKFLNSHVKFERDKMNVSLAAQTLSASVADVTDFFEYSFESS